MSAKRAAAAAGVTDGDGVWVDVCAVDDIVPDTGVCALVAGQQIALFRVGDDAEMYALDNFDPFSRAYVLSRGIIGDRDGAPKVASPMYKQAFALDTGQCLDDPGVRVPVYQLRVRSGRVEVWVPDERAPLEAVA